MNHETRTHLDLFSGIGGFSLAAQWAGFRTVGFCEIDPYAQQILIKNFGAVLADAENVRRSESSISKRHDNRNGPHNSQGWKIQLFNAAIECCPVVHPDIRTLRGTDYFGVDLITGGFPCQPYSLAGKRRGAADDRALWPEMRRVIAEARPRWVLAENVPGIINLELDTVLSDLESLGYATGTIVVPACAVDAPHRRDRIWIVAHADQGRTRCRGTSRKSGHPSFGNQDVADAAGEQIAWQGQRRLQPLSSQCCRWFPEPGLGRVANGIPNRVDRLKCLGNAIVPQVAAEILKAMIQSEESEPRGD